MIAIMNITAVCLNDMESINWEYWMNNLFHFVYVISFSRLCLRLKVQSCWKSNLKIFSMIFCESDLWSNTLVYWMWFLYLMQLFCKTKCYHKEKSLCLFEYLWHFANYTIHSLTIYLFYQNLELFSFHSLRSFSSKKYVV